ncbi:MAG: cupredoxin domain-containing protein [Actinomycetota bacterium]|nr:cupredoxin domain-containing protein [Actinomycetota bacterium]
MITTGAKWWFAVAGLSVVASVAWLAFSDGELTGLLTLLSVAVATSILGVLGVVLRDGDGDEEPAAASARAAAMAMPAGWPALGGLGVGVTLVGLAAGGALFYVGLAIVGVVVVEWMVQGWAERATDDRAENAALRKRIMYPLEIPGLALIGIVVVLLAFSRVLLALPKAGSTVVAIVVATLILAGAALVATRPRLSASLITGLLVLGGVGLLGGGIVGAVAGEREFEPHEEEEGGAEEEGTGDFVISVSGSDGFDQDELRIPADEAVTITFENLEDDIPHSLQIQGLGDEDLTTEEVAGGDTATLEVEAPAGEYTFIDPGFPNDLEGTLVVEGEDPSTNEQPENPDGGGEDTETTSEVSTP